MELRELSYFRTVARLEHMTRAAQELGVAQPVLSKAIGRLEREVGVPLFDRQGRGIRLNQLGAAFLAHVDRIFAELTTATDEIRDLAGLEQGTVSLAAGALHWLPEVLRPFIAAHPAVRCQLAQRSMAELHRLLEAGTVDLCFIPSAPAGPALHWRHLETAEVFLVVPAGHRLAGRASVALREVAGDQMVLGKPGDVLRETMGGYFRQADVAPRVACEADEPAAVEDFVAAGLGVAFIPSLPKPLPSHDMTSWVRISEPRCELTVGIAWNEARYLSQAARAFREHVVAHFAAKAETEVGSRSAFPLAGPGDTVTANQRR